MCMKITYKLSVTQLQQLM